MLLSFCSNLILTNINKLRITRDRNNEKNFWIKHTQVNVHSFLDISIVLQLKRHDGRHNSGKRIRVAYTTRTFPDSFWSLRTPTTSRRSLTQLRSR